MVINDALWLAVFRALTPFGDQSQVAKMASDVHAEIRRSGLKLMPLVSRSGERQMRWARDNGVPLEGDIAFASGWDVDKCNPHPPLSVANLRWTADWYRANADAFESHVHGHEPDDLGRKQ